MRKLKFLSVVSTFLAITIVLSIGTFAFASRTASGASEERIRPTLYFSRTTFNVPTLPPRPTIARNIPILTPRPTSVLKTSSSAPTVLPSRAPVVSAPAPQGSGDVVRDYIMNAINDYRRSQGLNLVSTDSYTCGFASVRVHEIVSNFDHSGFTERISSKTLPYPSYAEITENLAMTSNYKEVVNLWINSPGHAENMRKNTPYVCVSYEGNYYAYEGWRP